MNAYGMELTGRRRRRRHGVEFKAAVIGDCLEPGVSIAAVALAHGLNANLLRKWMIDAEHKCAAPAASVPTPRMAKSFRHGCRIGLCRPAGYPVALSWTPGTDDK